MEREALESIGRGVVECAVRVHRTLGPGLLESAYQFCMAHELRKRGFRLEQQVAVPVEYDGQCLETGYRLDMLIDGHVIVENKAVDRLLPIHEAQLLTYLKLRGCRLGYLLNWKVALMKDGIKRMVLGL